MSISGIFQGLSPDAQVILVMSAFVFACLVVVMVISSPGIMRNFCILISALADAIAHVRGQKQPDAPPTQKVP